VPGIGKGKGGAGMVIYQVAGTISKGMGNEFLNCVGILMGKLNK